MSWNFLTWLKGTHVWWLHTRHPAGQPLIASRRWEPAELERWRFGAGHKRRPPRRRLERVQGTHSQEKMMRGTVGAAIVLRDSKTKTDLLNDCHTACRMLCCRLCRITSCERHLSFTVLWWDYGTIFILRSCPVTRVLRNNEKSSVISPSDNWSKPALKVLKLGYTHRPESFQASLGDPEPMGQTNLPTPNHEWKHIYLRLLTTCDCCTGRHVHKRRKHLCTRMPGWISSFKHNWKPISNSIPPRDKAITINKPFYTTI